MIFLQSDYTLSIGILRDSTGDFTTGEKQGYLRGFLKDFSVELSGYFLATYSKIATPGSTNA